MDERELRGWVGRVKDGTLSRRAFTRMMVGLGLTAPMAAQMLASGASPTPRPSRRSRRPGGAAGASSRRSGGRPSAS